MYILWSHCLAQFVDNRNAYESIVNKSKHRMLKAKEAKIKLAVAMAACIVVLEEENPQQKRKRRKYDVSPYLQERELNSRYSDLENLFQSPSMFYETFHMPEKCFNKLFGLLEQDLIPKRNTRPDAIPIKAKLAIVLEFLASGDQQRHIGSTYRISKQHFGVIIEKVCDTICTVLQGEFPKWTTQNMLQWARGFQKKFNFPNCLGAVGGKHVPMKAPPNSSGLFNNYKGFPSIVLLAICDSFYRFTYIDVGGYGSEGDGNVLSQCDLGKALLLDELKFPEDNTLNGKFIPYFLVGDDAFPLNKRIMTPYSSTDLDTKERTYNNSLKSARHCIENAFSILCVKWMALTNSLLTKPCKLQKMIATCCTLHNFLMRESPATYKMLDSEISSKPVLIDLQPCQQDPEEEFEEMRSYLKEYINSVVVYSQVSWQAEYENSILGHSQECCTDDSDDIQCV